MTTRIGNIYELIAGHYLPKVSTYHKCKRPHGHNYEIEVVVSGEPAENGFIIDFFDLDKIVAPIIAKLDHQMLNDIPGLENPTAEIISEWFFNAIEPYIPAGAELTYIKVWETKNCWAITDNVRF